MARHAQLCAFGAGDAALNDACGRHRDKHVWPDMPSCALLVLVMPHTHAQMRPGRALGAHNAACAMTNFTQSRAW